MGMTPPPRELKIAAAYFALLGYSQKTIAKKIHRTPRTQQTWISRDDWPEYVAEAKKLFNTRLQGYARRALRRGISQKDGGWLALRILERMDEDYAPPVKPEKPAESNEPREIIVKYESLPYTNGTDAARPAAESGHVNGQAESPESR